MISDAELGSLRITAALVHALPDVRARVRHDGRTLVEVCRPDGLLPVEQSAVSLTPCEFRCAVAKAHRLQQAGRPLEFAGLLVGGELSIDMAAPPGGAARPGGLYRVPRHDHHVWSFGTTLDADVAHPLGLDLVDAASPLAEVAALGLRRDVATDVTLAYAQLRAPVGSPAEDDLIELLESLLARWATHQLVTSLGEAARDNRSM
jgi:hypothetical protein